MSSSIKRFTAILMTVMMALAAVSCGKGNVPELNLVDNDKETQKIVELFAPMERSNPDAKNVARTAFDKTVIMAEEKLKLRVEYNTYT